MRFYEEKKCSYFLFKFQFYLFFRVQLKMDRYWFDSMVPNRWQAITWISDETLQWHHAASISHNELNDRLNETKVNCNVITWSFLINGGTTLSVCTFFFVLFCFFSSTVRPSGYSSVRHTFEIFAHFHKTADRTDPKLGRWMNCGAPQAWLTWGHAPFDYFQVAHPLMHFGVATAWGIMSRDISVNASKNLK